MRCGPHVMLPLTPGSTARRIYEDWIVAVRPPVVKFCRQAFDPALMDWTRAGGCKIVGRWVEGDTGNGAATLNELLQFASHLDYIEFGNEERQGKDNPREWQRFMGDCLAFMVDLDKRNRAAGRAGPKACIANTSVGQPEVERWSLPETLECARYAAANGHVWGVHEYFKPEPWAMIEGGRAAWDGTPPAVGWLMLRVTQAVRIMRGHGVMFRFIITESGRDNIPGQPGPGGGFRDVPGEPFAEYMRQYGRHLSAMPECVGWVDFGFNAWEGWKQFDLTEDSAMAYGVIAAMQTLPGQTGGSTMTDLDKLAAEAAANQRIQLNPGSGLQKAARTRGWVGPAPTSGEWKSAAGAYAGRTAQRYEWPDGRVEVATWSPGTGRVEWVSIGPK